MRQRKIKIQGYTYEAHSVFSVHYHLIWVTKYRREIFVNDQLRDDMKKIINNISKTNDTIIENLKVMPDHIHMTVSIKAKYAVADKIKSFKGASAREWFKSHPETRSKLWGGHLWSRSYFLSTLGNVSKDTVDKYINEQMNREQEEHMRNGDGRASRYH